MTCIPFQKLYVIIFLKNRLISYKVEQNVKANALNIPPFLTDHLFDLSLFFVMNKNRLK
jgi:hypothetical protein